MKICRKMGYKADDILDIVPGLYDGKNKGLEIEWKGV